MPVPRTAAEGKAGAPRVVLRRDNDDAASSRAARQVARSRTASCAVLSTTPGILRSMRPAGTPSWIMRVPLTARRSRGNLMPRVRSSSFAGLRALRAQHDDAARILPRRDRTLRASARPACRRGRRSRRLSAAGLRAADSGRRKREASAGENATASGADQQASCAPGGAVLDGDRRCVSVQERARKGDPGRSEPRPGRTGRLSAFDQPDVAGAGALAGLFGLELHPLAFPQELEHRPTDRAAMEEVLDTRFRRG